MIETSPPKKPFHRRAVVGGAILAVIGLLYWIAVTIIRPFVAPFFVPLPEVLRRAQYVGIHRNGYTIVNPPRLSASEHPKALHWLSASADHPVPPPQAKPDYTFYIHIDHVTVHLYQYGYVSATGQIGSGREWRQTPPEFQSWMLALKAKPLGRAVPPPEPGDYSPVVVSPSN